MSAAPWQLLGRGSSKDLYSHAEYPQHVFFEFSDRVSVFDYGALPDSITGKGESLRRSAEFFFDLMQKAQIATAFDLELSRSTGRTAMRAVRHPKFLPNVDTGLVFIPLEVIFRWGVPEGSSLLKRRPELKAYDRFAAPMIEFSTKLEASDRLLSREEAQQIAGASVDIAMLEHFANSVAVLLQETFKARGLELWDGKIECAWDTRKKEIVMVDALTPDELRVTLKGFEKIPLSKELLRSWIGRSDWAFQIRQAKKKKGALWKESVPPPPRLGSWRLEKLSTLYRAFSDSLEQNSNAPLRDWVDKSTVAPKVCVVGNGGREAAIKWKLQQEGVDCVAQAAEADLTWVSPDGELAKGLVDDLARSGQWTYGPVRESAQVEWSKAFGREIAVAAGITVPRTSIDANDLRKFDRPPVIKLDGLAAGKGVIVPETWDEAEAALKKLSAQGKILLEDRLVGFEASAFFALESNASQNRCYFLGTAKDFKRRYPADEGPNTGGMGAYAPHPNLSADDIALFTKWAEATLAELDKRGLPYNGVLYLGLMKDSARGWHLIEYNSRLGDPETQALVLDWPKTPFLRSLLSLDLVDFKSRNEEWRREKSTSSVLCLALVNPSYPEPVSDEIQLPPWSVSGEGLQLFRTSSTKGRAAYLVSKATTLQEAGDIIFEKLLDSPWKDLLEWRPDILK